MFRKELIIRSYAFRRIITSTLSTNAPINIDKLEEDSAAVDVIDEDAKRKEEQIELKRNKSRLKDHDRAFLFDRNPYPEETYWYHGTLKYKRRLYGRYGEASGVDPALCWPTEAELHDSLEYEHVAHPFTIPEMIKSAKEKTALKEAETRKRQEEMLVKLSKLDGWKKDLEMRIAKKESEANAARLRKERLIEEVRKHFGYKVDPKDDKFKELLEKKEKEQRKLAKEARKKEKEAKMLEKLKDKKKEKKAGVSKEAADDSEEHLENVEESAKKDS